MAVVRSPDFLRALNQRDCACNIDPPASSYAIMRRAGPTAERTVGPARMIAESLTPKPGIREHNRGAKQTTVESKPERGSGGDPLRPMPDVPAPGATQLGQRARGVVSLSLRTSHGRGV